MLVTIAPADVTLGMFIHGLDGPWLQHPFWRRKFLLTDPRDLAKLHASSVKGVIVDDARGAAPGTPEPAAPPPAAPARAPIRTVRIDTLDPHPRTPVPLPRQVMPCSAAEEAARAGRIVRKSKQAVTRMFGEARLGKAISTGAIAPLVDEIADSVARNPLALIGIARLKSKDEYTYLHSVAVCALMINFARSLGLDEATVRDAGMAGLLHDIGKMAVPDAVLNKAGRLSDEEFALVRGHPERGHAILAATPGVSAAALDVCLHHHEKVDGSGYPFGLPAERLSLLARMGAICDVYDAITSNRCYKEAWSPADSIAKMMEWEGHFDESLLPKFIRSIGIYPVGTLVRLRSNRLGIVIAENRRDPTCPTVRAFYAITDRSFCAIEELTVGHSLKEDQIVGREIPERWRLDGWPALADALLNGRPLPPRAAA